MFKYILFIFIAVLFFNSAGVSQTKLKQKKLLTFSAGMGIDYGANPDFTDYLKDQIPYSNKDSIKSFHAGIEFFGGLEYDVAKNISVKLDYSYFLRSVNYAYSFFVFDYTIVQHQPYLFVNYVIKSDYYRFKFGLGVGFHFQNLDNKVNQSNTISYKSNGPGVRGEVVFSNKFSDRFWGYLGGFLFGNFYGKLKDDNGNILKPANSSSEASLSGYGVGVRLGFSFILN